MKWLPLKRTVYTAALTVLLLPTLALASSPIGTWKTIDDETGEAKSLVTITEQKNNGTFQGTVTKLLNPSQRGLLCELCKGDRKNQKVEGMTVLWGMQKEGEAYGDGKIIDPTSGKIYSANMKLLENGNKLEVRGYIGFSLLGRSQVWERVK